MDESASADTSQVPVYKYAVSRGKCDEFADAGEAGVAGADAAAIQDIRSNYGLDCNGVRLPATAKTLYTASGKLNYTYGTGSRVSLSLATQPESGPRASSASPIRYLNNLGSPARCRASPRGTTSRPSTGPRTSRRAPSARWRST